MEILTNGWADYELLDCGGGMKVERFGAFVLARPAPQALWKPSRPIAEWDPWAIYRRSSSGGGQWDVIRTLPDEWPIRWNQLTFNLKPTGFGHIGIFPEQQPFWEWIDHQVRAIPGQANVLNLFAYTGGSTLAALGAGAKVCHVDGSKGVVTWANRNASVSGFSDRPIRWIVDDALKFVQREARRGVQYHGIVLDPPSFGRGPKGQVWKIETHLPELFDAFRNILSPEHAFFLVTCHSANVSAPGLRNMIRILDSDSKSPIETGDILLNHSNSSLRLPAGVFARWVRSR